MGKIVRPGNCQKCGTPCKPDGHHTDYTRPLDVEWLCRPCHVKEHARLRPVRVPSVPRRLRTAANKTTKPVEPVDVYHEVTCPDCGGLGYYETVNVREIRKLRIEVGYSLRTMADKLGISPAYLSDMELGKRRMPDDIAGEIVEICEGSSR